MTIQEGTRVYCRSKPTFRGIVQSVLTNTIVVRLDEPYKGHSIAFFRKESLVPMTKLRQDL